jgi:hypothetical protein
MQQNTRFPRILAMTFGLGAPLIPGLLSLPFWTALLYFLGSGIFGLIWPYKSWQWGLWMTGPIIILALLSVAFVGGVDIFLKQDLPKLLLILVTACAGGMILPFFKKLLFKKKQVH